MLLSLAFQLFDSDRKGYVTIEDFYRVLAMRPKRRRSSKLSRAGPLTPTYGMSQSIEEISESGTIIIIIIIIIKWDISQE